MPRSLLVATLLLGLSSALGAQEQSALVDQLERGDVRARMKAVTATERIPPNDVTPELRDALRANLRWWVDRPRPFTGGGEWEGEAFLGAAAAVARLEDPATVPELILVINTGNRVPNVLAAMKAVSYPQVIAIVEDRDSETDLVGGALFTLKKMAGGEYGEPLTSDERARVARACSNLLRAGQEYRVLLRLPGAIMATGDEDLIARLRALADDPTGIEQLGVPAGYIESFQRLLRRELGIGS